MRVGNVCVQMAKISEHERGLLGLECDAPSSCMDATARAVS